MSAHQGVTADRPIGLVLTGGTIGAEQHGVVLSAGAETTGAEAGLLAAAWPWAGEPHAIVAEPLRKLSENLTPRDWPTIADAVRALIEVDGARGALVLHGTDTMSYTAAALSFLLADISAPIVLTGARLPAGSRGSDAQANTRTALLALGALGAGVYVAFGAGAKQPAPVHLGTRVRKQRADGHAFVSLNRDLVATVAGDRLTPVAPYAHRVRERSTQAVDERVLVLRLHPGLDFAAAYDTVARAGLRAVVVELYASATGPDTAERFSLPAFIRRCAERDVVVATTVPGGAGPVAEARAGTYETSVAIAEAGGVSLRDMSTEAATVKAMWALAQSDRPEDVSELLLAPIAGELSVPAQR
jgi:L-asparaginase